MPSPAYHSSSRFDAVLCDVDGCLVDEAGGPLDLVGLAKVAEHNRQARAHRDRPIVTLCTGRPISFGDCLCRVISNTLLPCVTENGVWLFDPATNQGHMDPTITPEQRDAVRGLQNWLATTYSAYGLSFQPGKAASVSPYHPDADWLKQIEPEIQAQCKLNHWPFRVTATWNYINCDLEHISKATGIARWLEYTGLDPARVAGIGDTASDRAIAMSVAWFAAPANRDPAIDDTTHYISPHEQIEGVLDILAQLEA